MTKKIFRSILLVAGIVLLASFLLVLGCLYNYFGTVQDAQMQDTLDLTALALEQGGKPYLQGINSDRYRFTWLDADGAVLFDTPAPSGSHAALEKTTSAAKRLSDGSELRISYAQANAGVLLVGMVQPICAVLAAALFLSAILAHRLSKRIVEPLNTLDLDHPLDNNVYEELSPLLNRINRQHRQIAAQVRDLAQKQSEFMQITGSLQEGLILLDNRGVIVSMNPAAQRLFEADAHAVGRDFMTLDHSAAMNTAIHTAMETGHSEMHAAHFGRVYQFDVTRIETDGAALGAVILTFDITEQETAEQMRREFTANVSHELKTPLMAIQGYAEGIQTGVLPVKESAGVIMEESDRMTELIEELLALSKIDSAQAKPEFLETDVTEIIKSVANSFAPVFENSHKTLKTELSCEAVVLCDEKQIRKAVSNLISNAFKYCKTTVTVACKNENDKTIIAISDDGDGIDKDDLPHVFERFYTGKKGNTGIGLALTKEIIKMHGGEIRVHNENGAVVEITLGNVNGKKSREKV